MGNRNKLTFKNMYVSTEMKLIFKKFKYRKGIFVVRTQNKRKSLFTS